MILPLPFTVDPDSGGLSTQLQEIPAGPGIYAFTVPGRPPHLGLALNLQKRLKRMLVTSDDTSVGAALRRRVGKVECWPTGSRLESLLLLYRLSKFHSPLDYIQRLRLRMPWLVGLLLRDAFPRLAISNGTLPQGSLVLGPFLSRELAQSYEQQVLRLFPIRRCTEALAPAADHPGCIYGEINQCLRPCQQAVQPSEYAGEVFQVADFLATNGKPARAAFAAERDKACEAHAFERAAEFHKRLEIIQAAASQRDPVITTVDQFSGLAVVPGAQAGQLKLWPMLDGFWQAPIVLDMAPEPVHPKSLGDRIRPQLFAAAGNPYAEGKALEELAVFSRWYYSTSRDGHWYPFRSPEELNYSRIARAISRMLHPAQSTAR